MLPRQRALLVLGVLVVLVGAYSVVHEHLYGVSLFSPAALPEKVRSATVISVFQAIPL